MTANPSAHGIVITVDGPGEVPAGGEFTAAVRVSCPAGCDLSAVPIVITGPNGMAATACRLEIAGPEGARNIVLAAPLTLGTHAYRFASAACDSGGIRHDAGAAVMPISVQAHDTSLAVWDIPTPVTRGRPFNLKVGAKSVSGCNLCGQAVCVSDASGKGVASAILGPAPWPGTDALYWAEMAALAPEVEGVFAWSARLDTAGLSPPHREATSRFTIAIMAPPRHRLTVKVVDETAAAGIANAQVRLGAFHAATREDGVAELMLPTGTYDLTAWKPGYTSPMVPVDMDADASIEVALAVLPRDDSDAAWQM
jgi:hypothetical protein